MDPSHFVKHPHQKNKKVEALEGHFRALEGLNLEEK
jgi:hypothetical protein